MSATLESKTSYHIVSALIPGTIIRFDYNTIKHIGVVIGHVSYSSKTRITIKDGNYVQISSNQQVEVLGHASDPKFAIILIATASVMD